MRGAVKSSRRGAPHCCDAFARPEGRRGAAASTRAFMHRPLECPPRRLPCLMGAGHVSQQPFWVGVNPIKSRAYVVAVHPQHIYLSHEWMPRGYMIEHPVSIVSGADKYLIAPYYGEQENQ